MKGIRRDYTRTTDLYCTEGHRANRKAFYDNLRQDNELLAREENWDENYVYVQLDRVESFYERIECELLDEYWENEDSDKSYSGRKQMAEDILELLWMRYEENRYE